MQRHAILPILLVTVAISGCATEPPADGSEEPVVTIASGTLASAGGDELGSVELSRGRNGLSLSIVANDLEAGRTHAFHLHATGACEAPDFSSAGGHLNPFGRSHGELSDNGKHLGDLPNLTVDSAGSAQVSVDLEGDADILLAEIMDSDGTAVMLHEGPDDYLSDPAGAAGPRIACAILSWNN